jgi:hypothetical protein
MVAPLANKRANFLQYLLRTYKLKYKFKKQQIVLRSIRGSSPNYTLSVRTIYSHLDLVRESFKNRYKMHVTYIVCEYCNFRAAYSRYSYKCIFRRTVARDYDHAFLHRKNPIVPFYRFEYCFENRRSVLILNPPPVQSYIQTTPGTHCRIHSILFEHILPLKGQSSEKIFS